MDVTASVEVAEGWVLAPPALVLDGSAERRSGVVDGLYRARASGEPMEALEQALLLQGEGVEGDRYSSGEGRFSAPGRSGQAVTLIEAEAIEALREEHGIVLGPGDARRNVVTRGINLNLLLGERFRLGAAECLGQRLAEPCSWLQQQTPSGTLRGLVHRGGLRADVVAGGPVRPGDAVEPL
jgi:MOSC domain-containing protein YiiM